MFGLVLRLTLKQIKEAKQLKVGNAKKKRTANA